MKPVIGGRNVQAARPCNAVEEVVRVSPLACAAAAVFGMACHSLPVVAQVAKAVIRDARGKDVGNASLIQINNGVLIILSVKGLPAGERALHIHAVGKCEPPFTTAGSHFNPSSRMHGLEATSGPHAGDMPNLHIPSSGELSVEIVNTMISLIKGQPNSVLDADGTAFVIHAGPDDNKTDPAGNAGDRIACGVITE